MFLKYLTIFFISMVPIVELRGAIPVAVGMGMQGWELFWAYVIAVVGNMLPVPLIYFFARKVLIWGKDNITRAKRAVRSSTPRQARVFLSL